MAALLDRFGSLPLFTLFFQLKTTVVNVRQKIFLNYNKHKRIISFPNKCASPSILNWKGLKMELSKPLHVFKHM